MRKVAVGLLPSLVAVLLGCGSVWPFTPVEKPAWVEAPVVGEESGRFISATGAAGPGLSSEEMLAQADRAARENLADAIADYSRQTLAAFLQAHAEYPPPTSPLCQELSGVLAAELAASLLRQSMMQDSWQEPDDRAYVLYRLPVALVNDELNEKLRYSLRHVNPFGAGADEAVAQMQSFLASRFQMRLAAAPPPGPTAPEAPAQYTTPAWLELDRHDSYPADRFLSVTGWGADLATAELAARRDLAARLDASLAGLVEALQARAAESALTANLPWLDPRSVVFADSDLVGTRIAERWRDPVTHTDYALAVLDRSTAAIVYRSAIRKAQDQSTGLLASARDQREAGNYAASLKSYLEAVAAAAQAVRTQLHAAVAAPPDSAAEFEGMVAEPVLAGAGEGLQSVLRRISVDKTSGDRQWMPPGVPPQKPFAVRVTAEAARKPVSGLPLRLVFDPVTGATAGVALTDNAGVAQWQVAGALPETAGNMLLAELDLQALCPQASLFRLSPPSTAFEYVLRSQANSHFVVHAREKTAGDTLVPTPLADALKEALSADGFRVVPDSDVLKYARASELRPDAPDAQVVDGFSALAEAIGPRVFLLIVAGQTEVRLQEKAKTTEGDLYIVYCPFRLRVLDGALPGDDKAVLEVTGTGKGAYLGKEEEAIRRARADAAAEAGSLLVRKLREKLGLRPG